MKTSIIVCAILIALGLSSQTTTRKRAQVKPAMKTILAKADSVIADSLLPDSVIALKKEVEQLGKELDKINAQSKQKLRSEVKLNEELKNQGSTLDRLANNIKVDTISRPAMPQSDLSPPDSIKVVQDHGRRNWFDRIFNRKP